MAKVSNEGRREWKYGRGGPGPNRLRKVRCTVEWCGWKGKRRDRLESRACPKCGVWPSTVVLVPEPGDQ